MGGKGKKHYSKQNTLNKGMKLCSRHSYQYYEKYCMCTLRYGNDLGFLCLFFI